MMYSKLALLRSCHLLSFKFFKPAVSLKSFHFISSKMLLKSYVPVTTHVRTFWESFPFLRPLFYEKDGLSRDKYELIYHARIYNYMFYAQLATFSLISGEIYIGLKYVYKTLFSTEVADTVTNVGPFTSDYTSLSSIIIILIFNLHGILTVNVAQTAILRIYFCEETDKFAFVKLGFNPLKSRLLHCNAGELQLMKENPFSFLFGNHKFNRERLFIRPDIFKSSHLYNSLLSKEYK